MSRGVKIELDGDGPGWMTLGGRGPRVRVQPGWILGVGNAQSFCAEAEWERFEPLEGPREVLLRHRENGYRIALDLNRADVTRVGEGTMEYLT